MRIPVKICGIRTAAEAAACVRVGVTAIGLNFYERSSRFVDTVAAEAVLQQVQPFVKTVGVFVNSDPEYVRSRLDLGIDLAQFHGDESAEFCRQFGRPYMRALSMHQGVELLDWARTYHDASALLLDSHVAGQRGGTGKTSDWSFVGDQVQRLLQHRDVEQLCRRVVLSGGLDPTNVTRAIKMVPADAVDVSSGVESSPGVKDPDRIARFVDAARTW